MKVIKSKRRSPVVRHSWNSAAKKCFAFTAISLYCLERQQSGVSESIAATKRECSEDSSCGDCTMCKRNQDQDQALAASTNLNLKRAAMRKRPDRLHVSLYQSMRVEGHTSERAEKDKMPSRKWTSSTTNSQRTSAQKIHGKDTTHAALTKRKKCARCATHPAPHPRGSLIHHSSQNEYLRLPTFPWRPVPDPRRLPSQT